MVEIAQESLIVNGTQISGVYWLLNPSPTGTQTTRVTVEFVSDAFGSELLIDKTVTLNPLEQGKIDFSWSPGGFEGTADVRVQVATDSDVIEDTVTISTEGNDSGGGGGGGGRDGDLLPLLLLGGVGVGAFFLIRRRRNQD